jgi:hypothetical protein
MIYFAAHSLSDLMDLAKRTWGSVLQYVIQAIQVVFPPMESLNIKDVIWSFKNFSANLLALNTIYAVVYIAIILYFTVLIFNRKKFEN